MEIGDVSLAAMLENGNVLPTNDNSVNSCHDSASEIKRILVMVSNLHVDSTCYAQVIVTGRLRFASNKVMGGLDS